MKPIIIPICPYCGANTEPTGYIADRCTNYKILVVLTEVGEFMADDGYEFFYLNITLH